MNNIAIETLTSVDRLETANVMRQAFNTVDQEWSEAESVAYIDRMLKTHQTFVAKMDEKIVGFVTAETKDDHVYIDAIATLPEYMHHGIAKELWGKLVEYAKSVNITTIKMIADPKSVAYQWYMRLGFEETGWVELSKDI